MIGCPTGGTRLFAFEPQLLLAAASLLTVTPSLLDHASLSFLHTMSLHRFTLLWVALDIVPQEYFWERRPACLVLTGVGRIWNFLHDLQPPILKPWTPPLDDSAGGSNCRLGV